MSDIIKKRVSESLGKEIKIFLNNGWRYAGKITNTDEQYVEIIDYKTSSYKIIKFEDIKDCEVVRWALRFIQKKFLKKLRIR